MHRHHLKALILLAVTDIYGTLTRAHNPLVHGSSPCEPTNSKAAHCAAFECLSYPPISPTAQFSGSLQKHKALLQKVWMNGDRQKAVYILKILRATQGNKANLGVGFCDGGGHV